MKIGYARVSTGEQNLDLQREALREAGCEPIFEDTASGATTTRPGLTGALTRCREHDVLVAWKLDRLGRSLIDLVGLVDALKQRGIGLKILTGQGVMIDTTRAEGRLIFGIFAALAEFERELIRERTKAGMAAARRRGVRLGRPARLKPSEVEEASALIAGGKARSEIAETYGVHSATLRRALKALR